MNSIKLKNKINLLTLLTLLIFLHPVMYAQLEVQEDKTLSPYFYIPDGESETEKLPLKSTRADVNIAGVIADVVITQNYKNEGSQPIEAIYVFPGSTRAAVYAMKMTIGERTIKAKIEEKNKARQDYEEARQNGQTASLLEQQRPNVFQMNVANIMPGDNIIVELKYTELLVPDEGVYAFVYPTVVGPRYSNTPESIASTNDRWIANPYTTEGKLPFYDFDLQVNLNAGLPVQDVACNTHETDIQFLDPTKVQIDLKPTESKGGNRDFILQYRLQGKQIESGLMLYEGKDENFFLLMMQPPKQVKSENIPPREYIFIVDVSGSMHGFPLDVSKTLLRDLIGNLRPYDKFNVMLFAGGSQLFAERSVDANSSNISRAISFIDKQRGGGGTELLPALKRALKLDGTEDFSRSFVIVTDGYVTVEKQAYELIRQNLGKANFFTFGIGSSVNRYILEGMAHVGNGTSFIATEKNEATAMADKFRKYASNPVLTNIEVNFKGLDVYDVEPLSVPDVFSERPVLVYGKYRGNPNGSVSLSGKTGNKRYNWGMDINEANPDKANVALRYLWA
ncbi:MAG: VWA domain-containing protein, partial [Bacteroidales bacterium]|nr:VWA domain-containing protein [Bacteroidales bacterium]